MLFLASGYFWEESNMCETGDRVSVNILGTRVSPGLIILLGLWSVVLSFFTHLFYEPISLKEGITIPIHEQSYNRLIFQYRWLGRSLLMPLIRGLRDLKLAYGLEIEPKEIIIQGYFVWHSLMNFLLSLCLFSIFRRKEYGFGLKSSLLTCIGVVGVVSLTYYELTPYDAISYVFLAIGWRYTLGLYSQHHGSSLAILLLVIVLATLNRESGYFIVMLVLIYSWWYQVKWQKQLAVAGLSVLAFLGGYVGIRAWIGFGGGVIGDFSFLMNAKIPGAWIGVVFWVIVIWTLFAVRAGPAQTWGMRWFLVGCLPYLLVCFFFGVWTETRLAIPILLSLLFLGQLNSENFHSTRVDKNHGKQLLDVIKPRFRIHSLVEK